MNQDYWHKQTAKPLFPELEWSRPESRLRAGKLLIVGGSGYEFQAPANAYGDALEAGIGSAKVLLPNSMQKTVSGLFPEAEFAPSTPSGSFALSALAQLLDLAGWADSVLIPGNLGRNSETAVLLEAFLNKYSGLVTLTKDAADLICQQPASVLQRPQSLLVLAIGQLRHLGNEAHFTTAFTSDMALVNLVEALHDLTSQFAPNVICRYQDQYLVAVDGQVSSTPVKGDERLWQLEAAATASVWWLQNPSTPFEALTTAMLQANI